MKGKAPSRFLGQDRRHVLVGAAAMDDQRQLRFARCGDVAPQPGLLVLRLLRVVEIVETGFADRDDLLMGIGQPHEIVRLDIEFVVRRCSDGCRPSRRPTDISR